MTQIYGDANTALGANQINKHAYERKALYDAVQEAIAPKPVWVCVICQRQTDSSWVFVSGRVIF